MAIGLSILLLAAGAILAFAVSATTYYGVDVHLVGWILMGAGALGLVWSVILMLSRRTSVVVEPRHEATTRVVERDLPADDVVRRESL